jgi:CheY-like chemotaxis protein
MASLHDSPISVLVADDEEDQRVLLRSILEEAEEARHVVTTVPDGMVWRFWRPSAEIPSDRR